MSVEKERPITASSIVRVAGNIASGMVSKDHVSMDTTSLQWIAKRSVELALLIVKEVDGTKCQ